MQIDTVLQRRRRRDRHQIKHHSRASAHPVKPKKQSLARYCVENRRSKSEVIIELLEQRFATETAEKTLYDLACESGFIGALTAETEAQAAQAPEPAIKARVRAAIARKHGRA